MTGDDKHRSLHLMFSALSHAEHHFSFTRCMYTSFSNPPERPTVPDAEVAHLTVVTTGLDPGMEVKPQISVYVALEDWSDMIEVLSQIRAEVTEIINAAQIRRAL